MQRLIVGIAGLALSVVAAVLALGGLGPVDATIFGALLAYVFGISFGANRLLTWLAANPAPWWKGLAIPVVCFTPMAIGWFPVSNWIFQFGLHHGWEGVPSFNWILVVMLVGLFGPGLPQPSSFQRSAR